MAASNPHATIGDNNGPPLDEPVEPDAISDAEMVLRCAKVLAGAFGAATRTVLKKKQPFETLSLRQLLVFCLTNDNPDLAIVAPVRLAKIIKFDRGTVRDDRVACERAAELDEEVRDYLDAARELILGVPTIARGAQRFFLTMDIARSKSRSRMLRLREAKRRFDETMDRITRSEAILSEIGRTDLSDHVADIRRKEPFNPAKDGRLAQWLAS